jgi:hypothetical protein
VHARAASSSTVAAMARPALALPETTIVELSRPGDRLGRRLVTIARRIRARYEARFGMHRGWSPRRSVVEHRVPGDALLVLDRLRQGGAFRSGDRHVRLSGDARTPTYDAVDHEYRVRSRLHLAWSWPELPMRLAVGELTPTMCTLRLSLRSRRRLRYPARYFDAAHGALTALERRLDGPAA